MPPEAGDIGEEGEVEGELNGERGANTLALGVGDMSRESIVALASATVAERMGGAFRFT